MSVYIKNNTGAKDTTLQETNTLLGNVITLLGAGGGGSGGNTASLAGLMKNIYPSQRESLQLFNEMERTTHPPLKHCPKKDEK